MRTCYHLWWSSPCLPRLLDMFHQGIGPHRSGNKMRSLDENNKLVLPVFFHRSFFYMAKVAHIHRKQKLWGKKSLIILLCFLATLFFWGHLWRFEPFCGTTGRPVIVVQRPFHISEMPLVRTYREPAQEVIMTAWIGTHLIYPALMPETNKLFGRTLGCWNRQP
jgi:hypothetical protein